MIYLMSDIGSRARGLLSSSMIRQGVSVNRARKTALFLCSLGVLPIAFAQTVTGMFTAMLILGLATASHQGFSMNLYTLVSDMFPKPAVASVAGIGGTCGYFGASMFQLVVGYLVVGSHPNYLVPFVCASLAYLAALGGIHLLAPRLAPANP